MKEYDNLKGKTIIGVREMNAEEVDLFGWADHGSTKPMVLILTGNLAIIPSMDPEGNGPGHLFVEKVA